MNLSSLEKAHKAGLRLQSLRLTIEENQIIIRRANGDIADATAAIERYEAEVRATLDELSALGITEN